MFFDKLNIQVVGEMGFEFGSSSSRGTMKNCVWLEAVRKRICYGVCLCVCACVFLRVCLCVMSMSKHLILIVRLLPNQLFCMVNKSVLIGSALQRLRYQKLIKSLFQPCLLARTKLCSVAMDTRQVTNNQTWKHSTGWRFSGDYVRRHVYSLQRFDLSPQYI